MASHHSAPPRGLNATRSRLSQGRFGRMFRNLPPGEFGRTEAANEENLEALALRMEAGFDPPTDGPDAEESGIPALYTYFGQFVDHDITFDPVSLLTKSQDPDGLVDFRTPALDLDNVYGRGPGDQPYMYDGMKFQLGDVLTGAGLADAHDLPRFRGRALIGDPRNDENSIVSQLQGLFHRFHNRMVDDNPGLGFEQVQRLVRFHYQYVVINDFLPKIISAPVLADLKHNGHYDRSRLKFFHWRDKPFMPVEFAVAAYRLGHSMIRPGYRLNAAVDMLLPIFPVPAQGFPVGLTGFQTMAPGRAIDWARFINIEERPYGGAGDKDVDQKRLQFAYRIDASLVNPLSGLPPTVAGDPPPSLALRNLLRGWRLGLPTGQAVARAMHLTPLKDEKLLIGKAVDKPADGEKLTPIATIANGAFVGKCPLWTYILAEAAHHKIAMKPVASGAPAAISTPQLGPVGGRIVAEVFLGMLFGDNASMVSLDPQFVPVSGPGFALKDLVAYALGRGPELH
ncbi:MAG: heme peroxidase [Xanthobacteraceae bacterium]|nr:heme peroxidase [Xanthobacteraceae bacterium]